MSQFQQEFITTAIEHYGLELADDRVDTVVESWFQIYDPAWIVKALVESLYRGRYKVKSVDNILKDWQRRGSPLFKFTPDYEREILQSLPSVLHRPIAPIPTPPATASAPAIELPASQSSIPERELDPEESAPFQHHDRPISPLQPNNEDDLQAKVTLPASGAEHPPSHERSDRSIASIPPVPTLDNYGDNGHNGRSIALPVKLYLFNKLRAIVEPNACHKEDIQHSLYQR
jgi:hypothetical protein